jgi:hypothetical protein
MRARRRLGGLLFLDVGGEDERGNSPLGERDADPSVDQVARLRGVHADFDELGHVLEEGVQVDLLLVVRAEREALLLADDGQHRRVVELRVVEAVQEVDRSRAGGGDADADLAGELRVAAGHEGGHLLVAYLDELRVPVGAVERAQEAVDPVTGVAEHAVDAPGRETFQNIVGNHGRHRSSSSRKLTVLMGGAARLQTSDRRLPPLKTGVTRSSS